MKPTSNNVALKNNQIFVLSHYLLHTGDQTKLLGVGAKFKAKKSL